MAPSRREFLRRSISTGFLLGLDQLASRIALGTAISFASGFGPLHPTPADDTGELLLAVPAGFRYRVLRRAGQPMTDGSLTPSNPDGMAAFAVDGRVRLVRNHEITEQGLRISLSAPYYDLLAAGGVTILELDPFTNQVLRDFVALSGTVRNCSGGVTPWGSWISCEETTTGAFARFPRPHGYCFEVHAAANDAVAAIPLRAMGRFLHEAVAVDPVTGIVYLTEDRPEAGLYRFVPYRPGQLAAGGVLQMLAIRERPRYDTRRGQVRGARLPVQWVDIGNPDPDNAEVDPSAVYRQGFANGGATFIRLEGATYTSGRIVFTATTGGNQGLGQIWELRVRNARSRAVGRGPRGAHETLTLLFESSSAAILKAPDNLCVSPLGSLVLCEDSTGGNQYLRVFNPQGEVFDLAKNIMPGFEHSEFAGATFSPDGRTLFVNMYLPGLTLAVTVPPL